MTCEICQRNPHQAGSLYRVNEKGVTGRWRCEMHPPKPGECCCSYLLDRMCGWHENQLLGPNDPVNKVLDQISRK